MRRACSDDRIDGSTIMQIISAKHNRSPQNSLSWQTNLVFHVLSPIWALNIFLWNKYVKESVSFLESTCLIIRQVWWQQIHPATRFIQYYGVDQEKGSFLFCSLFVSQFHNTKSTKYLNPKISEAQSMAEKIISLVFTC